MIALTNVAKHYGRRALLLDASFQLNPGEKVGLVGPNGSGKTTLFRLIVGEEKPDDGEVLAPKRVTIGYFRQDAGEMSGRSVLDETIAGAGRLGDLHHELIELERAMSDPERMDELDATLARFGEVQGEYGQLGGYDLEARAREILHGLGFEDSQIEGDVGALSGGWRMRVSIAKVLLGKPDVMLLDEPTNHLDILAAERLEEALSKPTEDRADVGFDGTLILISHDRALIDTTCDHLLVLDGAGNAEVFVGSFSEWHERKIERDRAASRETAERDRAREDQERKRKEAEKKEAERKAAAVAQRAAPTPAPSKRSSPAPVPAGKNRFSWMSLSQIEARMSEIQTELSDLEMKLADPSVWTDVARSNSLTGERTKARTELEELEEAWLKKTS